ncbi:LacI family transcriptional regulator [Paenibacillus sp. J5C_2022]|uniref:LacI family DNA-binding transcriptional regulator n=1 Tax=Paenibacillus sp. J5C2022 TaxID=2977129 RepID=UPI0021D1DD6D|nr:LacI family DNA-binding transcriptional regulator [Paenibacillus sp. J5C2022]MCU6709773.1 LacI family transcriptional regulator [Paenibacillus sp. J5C2022]
MNKPATIYDIAKHVNASPATVSRVLSNSKYPVRPALAEKIREAARELNYTPNSIGRQLKTNKTSTIGVIIPSITNPFYAAVVSGIEETASEQGYQVLLCNSQNNPELELQHLKNLQENQVKGVIISSIIDKNDGLKQYLSHGFKVVTIDQNHPDTDTCQINFDYAKGGHVIASHLLEQGHRDIAFLSAPLDRPSRQLIYQGYKEALHARGVDIDQARVLISSTSEESGKPITEFQQGKQLTRRLLQSKPWPTAIMASNDMLAFGVMNELVNKGIRVPEDISVAGFDNLEFAEIVAPALTTVEQPKQEMGAIASRLLIDLLNDVDNAPGEIMLQPQLVERKSVHAVT